LKIVTSDGNFDLSNFSSTTDFIGKRKNSACLQQMLSGAETIAGFISQFTEEPKPLSECITHHLLSNLMQRNIRMYFFPFHIRTKLSLAEPAIFTDASIKKKLCVDLFQAKAATSH
jgi:hypothetical protein